MADALVLTSFNLTKDTLCFFTEALVFTLTAVWLYSACFLTRGSKAHITNMPPRRPHMIGCKTITPLEEATAPVRKGNAAEPACPKLEEKPKSRMSAY